MATTMIVLAAGMGTRFGGPKQLVPVGPRGETILDYNTHDAAAAGFERVVVVTRPELRAEVERHVAAGVGRVADARIVLQRIPEGRTKPLGTADAVAVAAPEVVGPFGVANSDDLYGPGAFAAVHDAIAAPGADHAVVISLPLHETLPEHGAVTRAILDVDGDGWVRRIVETRGLTAGDLPDPDAPVSMNLWGFPPPVLAAVLEAVAAFAPADDAGEIFLPEVVGDLLRRDLLRVRALPSPERWSGMTNPDDVPAVRAHAARRWTAPLWPD